MPDPVLPELRLVMLAKELANNDRSRGSNLLLLAAAHLWDEDQGTFCNSADLAWTLVHDEDEEDEE